MRRRYGYSVVAAVAGAAVRSAAEPAEATVRWHSTSSAVAAAVVRHVPARSVQFVRSGGAESASQSRRLITMTDHRSQSIDELLANPALDANINPHAVSDRIGRLVRIHLFSREEARTIVLKRLCHECDIPQAQLLDPEYVDKDEPRTPDAERAY